MLLGGGPLLLRVAKWAKKNNHSVYVITSPRHANEEIHINGDSLSGKLKENKIPFAITSSIEEQRNIIKQGIADTFYLSIGAAWVFSAEILKELFDNRLLNLHGTRLPQYRGGGGFSWQIMNGNRLGFCVLHKVEVGVDDGDILACEEFIYPPECRTRRDYMTFQENKYSIFLEKLLTDAFVSGIKLPRISQLEHFSTYWPRLHTPSQGWVNWSWKASEIERFICAFDDPYSGAQTLWKKQIVHLKSVVADYNEGFFHPFQSGLILRNNKRWLVVSTRHGCIIIQSVVDSEGDNIISNMSPGDRFITPKNKLEGSFERIIYDSNGLK